MNNNKSDENKEIQTSNYLVTECVNPKKIDPIKKGMDLSLLSEAEKKQEYKPKIAKGIENPKVRKAVSSLRLSNPFRGI